MWNATKTGIDAAKTACFSKAQIVVQKTAEATGNFIENKTADQITSLGKPKVKINKVEEIYISPEKKQEIIDDLKLLRTQNVLLFYKNGISKNCKFARYNF